MTDRTPDLDSIIEAAWRDFRSALAEALDALADDASVRVDFAHEDVAPYVQALRLGDRILLEAASNRFLDEGWKLDKADRRQLRAIGFHKPSDTMPNYWIVLPMTHVDQAASMAVSALRDAFRILHPSYLIGDNIDWRSEPFPPAPDAPIEDATATFPDSTDHLNRLIEHSLANLLDEVPERDSDGDLPIRFDNNVVFVGTHPERPMIRLFSVIAKDVTDHEAALQEVARLNRTVEGVKFVIVKSTIVAAAELLAWPYTPTQFQALLAHVCDTVAKHEDDLVERVGGQHFLQPPERKDDDPIHPAMLSILQLDAENPGALRPKDAARICDNDPDLLLELIRWNEEQEIAWREACEETDDPEEARVCEIERKHAHRTVKLLRKALRRVLLD